MTSFDFTDSPTWGGRPVARRIADCDSRARAVVTGVIVSVGTRVIGGSESFTCVLSDGTGELQLVFLGRHHVLGFCVGTRCTAEGTARIASGHLAIWNPLYRLDLETANDCDPRPHAQ